MLPKPVNSVCYRHLVARLSKLCADLGQAVVISDAVAGLSRRELVSLGRHELKGIDAPQEVFTIAG